ncbi:transcriptional activator Ogr/delta [Desulfovibrio sp. X2]|uniref:ogr/Delta-like zinc finger family protein n=1 Tax=Desulfovibrio sp. X2 TaxID=941449 RepID=UPI000358BE04|nr:ogr/Delta-like zinc finger family protein [Desulfovibrio sp. X2]EPR43125.1 transcriptional activator Ogr/delta [Desulfovibrio sp. X2]
MRIICDRCKSKAIITTTRELTPQFRKLYCACTNPECGHTFVVNVEFSHTLSPSALDLPDTVRQALRSCSTPTQARQVLAG